MKTYQIPFYGFFYRLIMRVAHKEWHTDDRVRLEGYARELLKDFIAERNEQWQEYWMENQR